MPVVTVVTVVIVVTLLTVVTIVTKMIVLKIKLVTKKIEEEKNL